MVDGEAPRPKRRRTNAQPVPPDFTLATKPTSRYHCNICHEDLSSVVHIKCAVCADFDACVDCFSVGAELDGHLRNHSYKVVDNQNFPLLTPDWGADEEIALLEACLLLGVGNWEGIAKSLGTKTALQCSNHYFSKYIHCPTGPLPDVTRVLSTRATRNTRATGPPEPLPQTPADGFNKFGTFCPLPKMPTKMEHNPAYWGMLEKFPEHRPSERDEPKVDEKKPKPREAGDHSGYFLHRDEFETEYNHDAEKVLMSMTYKPNDVEVTPLERELQVKVLDVYNSRLNERLRRKHFVMDRGLLNLKKIQAQEKRMSRDEREVYANLRPFARFCTLDEYRELQKGLNMENALRKQIEVCMHYRHVGITDIADSFEYERCRKKRTKQHELKRAKAGSSYLYNNSRGVNNRGVRHLARDLEMQLRPIEVAKQQRKPGEPLDISNMDGFELLSKEERTLCSEIRLLPAQFFLVKEKLLDQDILSGGRLQLADARSLLKIDVDKTKVLYDFFRAAGWIGTQLAPPSAADGEAALGGAGSADAPSSVQASPARPAPAATTAAATAAAATATASAS